MYIIYRRLFLIIGRDTQFSVGPLGGIGEGRVAKEVLTAIPQVIEHVEPGHGDRKSGNGHIISSLQVALLSVQVALVKLRVLWGLQPLQQWIRLLGWFSVSTIQTGSCAKTATRSDR